jgi:3',5'-cyclic AMP phosphodiesterase CpdA
MRIIQISDLHLSPTHGFFIENWRKAAAYINGLEPDLVVVTGDLSINGPDDERELPFARSELDRLSVPWRALPGNHDVGDQPPGQDEEQLVNDVREKRWRDSFGESCWVEDREGWRLIGLDSQLFGAGIADEQRQDRFLSETLASAEGRRLGVFMHKPLYLMGMADPASTGPVPPEPRRRLADMFEQAKVSFVASGHLHCYRQERFGSIDLVWSPATSFLHRGDESGVSRKPADAVHEPGMLVFDLGSDGYSHRFEKVPELKHLELSEIKQKGRYAFLRDMPPYYPPEAA